MAWLALAQHWETDTGDEVMEVHTKERRCEDRGRDNRDRPQAEGHLTPPEEGRHGFSPSL